MGHWSCSGDPPGSATSTPSSPDGSGRGHRSVGHSTQGGQLIPHLSESQVVTVFRSRLRADANPAFGEMAEEMETAARHVPGFVDFKTFTADDGERVSLVTFASSEAHRTWRDDPRHRQVRWASLDAKVTNDTRSPSSAVNVLKSTKPGTCRAAVSISSAISPKAGLASARNRERKTLTTSDSLRCGIN